MRDPDRIDEVLDKIKQIWEENPDLRLGQLVLNIAPSCETPSIFYLEDDELIEQLESAYGSPEADELKKWHVVMYTRFSIFEKDVEALNAEHAMNQVLEDNLETIALNFEYESATPLNECGYDGFVEGFRFDIGLSGLSFEVFTEDS